MLRFVHMHYKTLLTLTSLVFVGSLFVHVSPVFALGDGDSCVPGSSPKTGSDGFLLICVTETVNGQTVGFYQSCGFSPQPAGCPAPPTTYNPGPVTTTPLSPTSPAIPGCLPGYAFSTITGQPCQTVLSGCAPGYTYNILTGQLCSASSSTGAPTGSGTASTGSNTSTTGALSLTVGNQQITITPDAAVSIIQSLARTAGVSSGVTITSSQSGSTATINGVTFTGSSNTDLAAKYLAYLQGGTTSTGSTSGGTGGTIGTTVVEYLTVDLCLSGCTNPPAQMKILQGYLATENVGPVVISGFFDQQTEAAVKTLQAKYAGEILAPAGLTVPTGYVGASTRAFINKKLSLLRAGGGSGTPTATNYCTSSDQIINVAWPASGQVRPATTNLKDQAVAFKITVPTTFSPALNINHLGFFRIAEVPDTTVTGRDLSVSKNPCDFNRVTSIDTNEVGVGDTAPGLNYTVNNPNGYRTLGATFNLQSGDTVYVNVRNRSAQGGLSCPTATCNVLFDFATPNRY